MPIIRSQFACNEKGVATTSANTSTLNVVALINSRFTGSDQLFNTHMVKV